LKKSQRLLPKLSPDQLKLFKKLRFKKKDVEIFLTALTHPSYSAENNVESYQRLEFLGDAVVGLYVANILFLTHKGWDEGELTRARASMVSKPALAGSARFFGINGCMRLGTGEEQSGGQNRDSNLCDIFEAVIGALFLSRGFNFTKILLDRLDPFLKESKLEDAKSKLQRICSEKDFGQPVYKIVNEEGDPHNRIFFAEVIVENVNYSGSGASKKTAEMDSAENALKFLNQ
jgi:ribonuclease III